MIILGHIFNIIIFLSFIGGTFSVLTLLLKKLLQVGLPLWFHLFGIGCYLLPLILPTLHLVPPGENSWRYGYHVASLVWIAGVIIFALCHLIKVIFAFQALKMYRKCDEKKINSIYEVCVASLGLRKAPNVYFGTLKEPACVVTTLHPSIILNEEIVRQLTDKELEIVLCHELSHIKHFHHLYQYVFHIVSIIHWFNPFVWIAKSDFALYCEVDCDKRVLTLKGGGISGIEYATVMLHLMELSSAQYKNHGNNMEVLGFILARQRIRFILNSPTKTQLVISKIILILFITSTILFSVYASRSYFYPYPAYDRGNEYSMSGNGQ